MPLAQQIGMDPLQLGLMMVINLGVGLYTPPVGTTLFISTTIAGSTMAETKTISMAGKGGCWPYRTSGRNQCFVLRSISSRRRNFR